MTATLTRCLAKANDNKNHHDQSQGTEASSSSSASSCEDWTVSAVAILSLYRFLLARDQQSNVTGVMDISTQSELVTTLQSMQERLAALEVHEETHTQCLKSTSNNSISSLQHHNQHGRLIFTAAVEAVLEAMATVNNMEARV